MIADQVRLSRVPEEIPLKDRIAAEIRVFLAQHLRGIALLTRTQPPPTQRGSERVAQAVEHVTFNHGVEGSSPSALTMEINDLSDIFSTLEW